jgi:predicted glutamine amidotransferase
MSDDSRVCPSRRTHACHLGTINGRPQTEAMCRWLAYSGAPVPLAEALYAPAHSLIDQSLHSTLGAETTNGDGFGVGWYGATPRPGIFRSIEPAWNDANLRELADHVSSGCFFGHIRAAIGSAVQQTNCHPFRHDRWLFMHNGYIDDFQAIKRDLVLSIHPSLYPEMKGQTDTEVLFLLALTFGLEDDPPHAVGRALGLVEAVGHAHGVEFPFQGTIATTDGERTWAFRYSSEGKSRSLYFTTSVETLRELYPTNALLNRMSDDARLIVSEPLGDLAGAWNEVPEASYGVVGGRGEDRLLPFVLKPPKKEDVERIGSWAA